MRQIYCECPQYISKMLLQRMKVIFGTRPFHHRFRVYHFRIWHCSFYTEPAPKMHDKMLSGFPSVSLFGIWYTCSRIHSQMTTTSLVLHDLLWVFWTNTTNTQYVSNNAVYLSFKTYFLRFTFHFCFACNIRAAPNRVSFSGVLLFAPKVSIKITLASVFIVSFVFCWFPKFSFISPFEWSIKSRNRE